MKILKLPKIFKLTLKDMVCAEKFLITFMWKISPWRTFISIAINAMNFFLPYLTAFLGKKIVDQMIISFDNWNVVDSLWSFIGIYFGIQVITTIAREASHIPAFDLGEKARRKLDLEMMDRLSHLDSAFYDDSENRDILDKVGQYQNMVVNSSNTYISVFMLLISLSIGLTLFLPYNPILGMFYILTYLPGAIVSYKQQQKMQWYSIQFVPENRKKNYYRSILTEAYYIKDLRLYNLDDFMKEKFNSIWNLLRQQRTNIFKEGTWAMLLSSIISVTGFVVILCWAIYAVVNGYMTIGMLTLFISLSAKTGMDFASIIILPVHFNIELPFVLAYANFIKINNHEVDVGQEKMPDLPEIEFCNVYFKYPGNNEYTLKQLNFKINSGEKVALIGINGAGKTTIVKLLLRLYDVTEGLILIGGKSIKCYPLSELYSLFSVCFQDIILYSMSMRENIAISDINRINETDEIIYAAKRSGANTIYEKFITGIDTNLTRQFDEQGYEPSGGEWQKLALSRAFFKNSDIIILDEPSSALDPEAEDFIFNSYKKLSCNKSSIIISHRLSCVSLVDKIILLQNGTVGESGTHNELMHLNGEYSKYYQMQANFYTGGEQGNGK